MLHLGYLKHLSNGAIVKKDCSWPESASTCGAGINMYNIVADNPITLSSNNCTSSNVTYNYKYGITTPIPFSKEFLQTLQSLQSTKEAHVLQDTTLHAHRIPIATVNISETP